MTALKKLALYSIIALLTAMLFGCGDPAADREEIEEEELQEEVEENDEEAKVEEDDEEIDNESGVENSSSSSGTSGSGFSHSVEMNINGEVKEGEGEEWWKDEEGGSNDEWWDD